MIKRILLHFHNRIKMNFFTRIIDFFHQFEHPRRRRLRQQPFPMEWEVILRNKWPLWKKLKPESQEKQKKDIQVFLAEKPFEGCGGLEINDSIRVLTAAQACLLLYGDVIDNYPLLRVILVYPGKYRAKVKDILPAGVIQEGDQWRSGESWSRGHVVLAWDEVQKGAAIGHDGQNLVLHEFAHQIDSAIGITRLTEAWVEHRAEPKSIWIKAFAEEWMNFLENLQRGQKPMFDSYGAQNAAEFFAVTTESFIEQHREFKKQAPKLYELLTELYCFDPNELFN